MSDAGETVERSHVTRQCLDRRIPSEALLESEALAWQEQRNQAGIQIAWTFTTAKARVKYEYVNSKN